MSPNHRRIASVALALVLPLAGCDTLSKVLWESKTRSVDYRAVAQPAKPNASFKVALDGARSDSRVKVFALDLPETGLLIVNGSPDGVSAQEAWIETIVLPPEGDAPLAKGSLPLEAIAGPGKVYVAFSVASQDAAKLDVLLSFHKGVTEK